MIRERIKNRLKLIGSQEKILKILNSISPKVTFRRFESMYPEIDTSKQSSTTKKIPKAAEKTGDKRIDKKPSNIQLEPIPRSFRKDMWKVQPEIACMSFRLKL